ncbi:uncharacterized protein LOC117175646 [Belonocnema kinseyi]|uniref:uncharacterized protein LOC117175646 n=1 Tax=Belonocnema kinseyi TaxID=2817044 RepID=UPI00143D7982|nr:uncharacterized protein LOC117175646 [Belonocnema kinseyi]
MDVSTGLGTVSHSSSEPRMAKKQRSEFHNVHTMALNSPDANAMDYSLWAILESKVRTKRYTSFGTIKKAIVREWAKIPASNIRATCDSFLDRLKAVVKAKGCHIEQK